MIQARNPKRPKRSMVRTMTPAERQRLCRQRRQAQLDGYIQALLQIEATVADPDARRIAAEALSR